MKFLLIVLALSFSVFAVENVSADITGTDSCANPNVNNQQAVKSDSSQSQTDTGITTPAVKSN
jgi:hypothetical protein